MKRYGKAHKARAKTLAPLSPKDRAELDRFAGFLRDKAIMSPEALVDKRREYLGLNELAKGEALPAQV